MDIMILMKKKYIQKEQSQLLKNITTSCEIKEAFLVYTVST